MSASCNVQLVEIISKVSTAGIQTKKKLRYGKFGHYIIPILPFVPFHTFDDYYYSSMWKTVLVKNCTPDWKCIFSLCPLQMTFAVSLMN